MYKTRYTLFVVVAAFSLMLLGSRSFAQGNEPAQGTLVGGYAAGGPYTIYDPEVPFAFEASHLIGYQVYSQDYFLENLGQITDVLIDRCDGRAAFVVVSDTPGFGSEHLIVPFGALRRTGEHTFQVVVWNKPDLMNYYWEMYDTQNGDRFARYLVENRNIVGLWSVPATIDPVWADHVYEFYGLTPYWSEQGETLHPEFVSFVASGRTDDLYIQFPDGRLVAFNPERSLYVGLSPQWTSYGVAPYWTTYGVDPYWTTCVSGSCGGEPVADVASPPMPSNAEPGCCYARVYVPPRCETVTDQVMTRAASERVEQIPAKYETVQENVMVQPASKKIEKIPAEYKTVDEQVLVEAAHTEWREGRGAVEKMDEATGKMMCLVEIPAKYKTVQKQVLVKPESTREVEIPAKYETRSVQKLVEPAHENHIQIPAEYKTVTKNEKVADGYWEWRKVECQAK